MYSCKTYTFEILVEKYSTTRLDDNPETLKPINKCHRHFKFWNMTSLLWGCDKFRVSMAVFCYSKEGVELLLCQIYLPVVHEVEHGLEVGVLHTLQGEERVLVVVSTENISKVGAAGREDHIVSLNLLIITGQCYIK